MLWRPCLGSRGCENVLAFHWTPEMVCEKGSKNELTSCGYLRKGNVIGLGHRGLLRPDRQQPGPVFSKDNGHWLTSVYVSEWQRSPHCFMCVCVCVVCRKAQQNYEMENLTEKGKVIPSSASQVLPVQVEGRTESLSEAGVGKGASPGHSRSGKVKVWEEREEGGPSPSGQSSLIHSLICIGKSERSAAQDQLWLCSCRQRPPAAETLRRRGRVGSPQSHAGRQRPRCLEGRAGKCRDTMMGNCRRKGAPGPFQLTPLFYTWENSRGAMGLSTVCPSVSNCRDLGEHPQLRTEGRSCVHPVLLQD